MLYLERFMKSTALYGLGEDARLMKKRADQKALTYILTASIILITVTAIAFVSLPKIINANSVSQTFNTYEVELALKKMNGYRDTTASLLEDNEEKPGFFEIFPEPEYKTGTYLYEYSGWFSSGSAVTYSAWAHAYDLYNRGLIHGATAGRWCTFFAQMWFYDVYGFNSSGNSPAGDGAQFASTVYANSVYYDEDGNLCHYFEYGNKPMTMGIVSITNVYGGSGHVLCVDEVDYINNTITVSEGNVSGYGDCRIRQTMSLDTFYYLNPGHKIYVNPTPELINMISED